MTEREIYKVQLGFPLAELVEELMEICKGTDVYYRLDGETPEPWHSTMEVSFQGELLDIVLIVERWVSQEMSLQAADVSEMYNREELLELIEPHRVD